MLNRNAIEDHAAGVETHEILRNICIPGARAGNPDGSACDYLKQLPALTEPIGVRAAFWKARGIERHPDQFYPIYYGIAREVKPRRIAEIGVWWGYALMAMVQGALMAGVPRQELFVAGFDLESYPEAGSCLSWAQQAFADIGVASQMFHCNSRECDAKGLPPMIQVAGHPVLTITQAWENGAPSAGNLIDLFSVDGEHTYEDALRDLVLAEAVMSTHPEATIIVDDVGWALNVRTAVEEFCRNYNWRPMWLPTLKGTAVLQRCT